MEKTLKLLERGKIDDNTYMNIKAHCTKCNFMNKDVNFNKLTDLLRDLSIFENADLSMCNVKDNEILILIQSENLTYRRLMYINESGDYLVFSINLNKFKKVARIVVLDLQDNLLEIAETGRFIHDNRVLAKIRVNPKFPNYYKEVFIRPSLKF
jgi:hypothetical protein